jgi:hypothetical protein
VGPRAGLDVVGESNFFSIPFKSHLAYISEEKIISLCLTKHNAMKAYWVSGGSSTHSLTSALHGGEWSASCPGRFTPRERASGSHWIGG